MPLDFSQLAGQVEAYVPRLQRDTAAAQAEAARLRAALLAIGEAWPAAPERRAGLMEDPALVYGAPPCPPDYQVVATDGSQVAADRHQPAPCYVINIGTVRLQYGSHPDASLGSTPHLLPDRAPEGTDDDNGDPDLPAPSRQASLELERAAAELRALFELAQAAPSGLFTLALVDNPLVLWSQTMNADKALDHALIRRYIETLAAFADLARTRPLALAGYVSYPSSTWVAEVVNRTHAAGSTPEAPAVYDRDLYSTLVDGERTARFKRIAPMLKLEGYPADCWVDFCYLRAGGEIARLEVPRWVSRDPSLLGLAHAAVLDQCRRNQGNPAYPVALMEAHEQAVVPEADRRAFWALLGQRLETEGLPTEMSAKARTKRTPWT